MGRQNCSTSNSTRGTPSIFASGIPTAFGAYLRAPIGIRHGVGLYVLTLTGDRICAMTRFENSVLPWFGLPLALPSQ